MNIWAWYRRARERLAEGDGRAQRLRELLDALPTAVVNEAHERVDAMVPEALGLARELDEPWIEVFVRHWSLQSRVLHRRRAGDELREAVELLDFANQPRTRECPQSVCTVQDLAVCYAIRDGPGYVPERLAVARETLTRIDPSWGCYDCINGEYVSALFDDQRPAEALAWIDQQEARAAEHGEFEPGFNARLNRARALRELGRGRESLVVLDGIHDIKRYGSARLMGWRQDRVAAMLSIGETAMALELHPPLGAVIATGSHLRGWVDNTVGLIERGALANSAAVGRELHEALLRFVDGHAYWDTARTALLGARLAIARGARTIARMSIADAEPARAKLRRPQRLASLVAEVEAGLAELDARASHSPDTAADTLEHRLDQLWPDPSSPRQTIELAAVLRALGRSAEARAKLDSLLDGSEGRPLDPGLGLELAATMLASADHAGLDRLCAEAARPLAPELAWLRGQSLIERGRLREAVELDLASAAVLDGTGHDSTRVWLRIAKTARALGDWAANLDALDVAARSLPPGPVDWRRIMAATILGDWIRVRCAGARLGLQLEGREREPIDRDGRLIRCEFIDEQGERSRFWAIQTSPCGARVVEIALPSQTQRFRDRVVFEPAALIGEGATGMGPRDAPATVVAVLESGDYRSFLARGFDPGELAVERLADAITAHGWGFERISAPGRTSSDPRPNTEPDASVATMAVLVAISSTDDGHQLAALLTEHGSGWRLPLLCPELDAWRGDAVAAREAGTMLEHWQP